MVRTSTPEDPNFPPKIRIPNFILHENGLGSGFPLQGPNNNVSKTSRSGLPHQGSNCEVSIFRNLFPKHFYPFSFIQTCPGLSFSHPNTAKSCMLALVSSVFILFCKFHYTKLKFNIIYYKKNTIIK